MEPPVSLQTELTFNGFERASPEFLRAMPRERGELSPAENPRVLLAF